MANGLSGHPNEVVLIIIIWYESIGKLRQYDGTILGVRY